MPGPDYCDMGLPPGVVAILQVQAHGLAAGQWMSTITRGTSSNFEIGTETRTLLWTQGAWRAPRVNRVSMDASFPDGDTKELATGAPYAGPIE
jgi:hypothetical protein